MDTIPNNAGAVTVEIAIVLPVLCQHAGEPQPGSTLTWRYVAAGALLALDACRAWPEAQMAEPLDLETLTQRAASDAAAALGVSVAAVGRYILRDGTVLTCHATSN